MTILELPAPKFSIRDNYSPYSFSLADVVSAMSYALDITEGQPLGHSNKSCVIAMRIAQLLNLNEQQQSDLFYATLLKDAGCSSNAAKVCSLFSADDRTIKESIKVTDTRNKALAFGFMRKNVAPEQSTLSKAIQIFKLIGQPNAAKEIIKTRCSRGADIARKFGFSDATAKAIEALDEHWDGGGEPVGMKGPEIPLLGRIACLSQTVEVYHRTFGKSEAIEVARQRSGRWFDPELVQCVKSLRNDQDFWDLLSQEDVRDVLGDYEPKDIRLKLTEDRLDAIAEGFADVIDAKSPWTYRHSHGVAEATCGILQQFGYSDEAIRLWRRAGLLHDIGKLGVSNLILDKPDKLTDDEFGQMKKHVSYTRQILDLVPCFEEFSAVAAAHHEKLDGSGYGLGLDRTNLPLEARVLCVADIFDALSAQRPYRKRKLSMDEVFDIMEKEADTKICGTSLEALKLHLGLA